MVQIKYIIITFVLTCLCYVICDDYGILLPEVVDAGDYNQIDITRLSGTFNQVQKKYICQVDNVDNEELLLYGTKAWRFPLQDVNLTLRYPSENLQDPDDRVISRVTVILSLDGVHRGGYIKSGGMLQDNIVMTFFMANTSRLTYQFWLYGISRYSYNLTSLNERALC